MTRDPRSSWRSSRGAACTNATELPKPKLEPARGVLYPHPPGVQVGRFWPSPELAAFVEHYWWVRWQVAQPQIQEVLSYPSVHVVFEGADARIVGIVRARFTRRLEGGGSVCAIKFQPGMFRLIHAEPAVRLTDRSIALGAELGRPASALAAELARLPSEPARVQLLEECLRAVVPEPSAHAELARDLVALAREDSSLQSAAGLARAGGLTLRGLERLFRDYIGVGPKWVVRRFRLQEAADRLQSGAETVAAVAASLGYFDQAHFVRDFKAVVGSTPSEYKQEAKAPRPPASEE
jgi:AraC-like DNA-binding protein